MINMKKVEVKDCSNCIYNINNQRCEVMKKLLWYEECFAWANINEAIKREEAILKYSASENELSIKKIKKYKKKVLAYGQA